MIQLRVFHILCIAKYHSERYKADFINEVKELLKRLMNVREVDRVQVVIGCDSLCEDCLKNRKIFCQKDKDDCNETIMKKEREILQCLEVQENFIYDLEFLFNLIERGLCDKGVYNKVHCRSCKWNDKCDLYQELII